MLVATNISARPPQQLPSRGAVFRAALTPICCSSFAGSLTALVCQHSITPLALPCKLLIPDRGTRSGPPCCSGWPRACRVRRVGSVRIHRQKSDRNLPLSCALWVNPKECRVAHPSRPTRGSAQRRRHLTGFVNGFPG